MFTNAGFDLAQIAKDAKAAQELDIFEQLHADAHQRAIRDSKGFTGTAPEVVQADSPALARREWTFDDSPGKEDREVKQVREALAYGKLQPTVFLNEGTHVRSIFDNDKMIEAMGEGRACIRCREVPKQTEHEQRELHERLQSVVPYPYTIPDDVMGHCGYCGAVLGGKQQVA